MLISRFQQSPWYGYIDFFFQENSFLCSVYPDVSLVQLSLGNWPHIMFASLIWAQLKIFTILLKGQHNFWALYIEDNLMHRMYSKSKSKGLK